MAGRSKPRAGASAPLSFLSSSVPASQTLIVLSHEPDTILLPSGENATEEIELLWAWAFSLLSSRVPVWEGRRGKIWLRRGDLRPKLHQNPRL